MFKFGEFGLHAAAKFKVRSITEFGFGLATQLKFGEFGLNAIATYTKISDSGPYATATLFKSCTIGSCTIAASFINGDGLRVASSNFKVGFHTDTTKYGLCTTWVKFGLDAKSGLRKPGRAASTSLSGVASSFDDYGL